MKTALFILLAFSGAVSVLYAALVAAFGRNRPLSVSPEPGTDWPFVSLLKPVKGFDDDLAGNLESFYRLDYPRYEVLFAVDDRRDPCLAVIEAVASAHPLVATKIIATGRPPDENPKIHKLARLEAESRGVLLWTTDADVRVSPGTLRRLVSEYLSHDAKIVFSPLRGTGSLSFASLMANAGLRFFTSGGVLAAWLLGRRPVIVGKSILMERAALAAFGGFAYFKDFLAEDFLLGETFAKSGFPVSTNFTWVTCISRKTSLKRFANRLSRWAKLRFRLAPSAYVLEVLLNPVILSLAVWAVLGLGGWRVPAAAAAGKIALEYAGFLILGQEDRRRLLNHLLFPAAVLAKDLLFFAVYFAPFFSRRVDWRGGRVTIGRQTLIQTPGNRDALAYDGA